RGRARLSDRGGQRLDRLLRAAEDAAACRRPARAGDPCGRRHAGDQGPARPARLRAHQRPRRANPPSARPPEPGPGGGAGKGEPGAELICPHRASVPPRSRPPTGRSAMARIDDYARKYSQIRLERRNGILEMTLHTDGGPLRWGPVIQAELVDAFTEIGA